MKRLRLGVLASGGGTNLQSIIDRSLDGTLSADVVVVVSNNSHAGALERARKHNIDALHISAMTEGSEDEADSRMTQEMRMRQVDLVILAGYMKIIGPLLLSTFNGRMLNIHPALLPKFGGKGMYGIHVHEAVISSKEKESGASVHIVDSVYDHGTVLAQMKVPVLPDDTPEILQKRVLVKEHELYPQTIHKIAEHWNYFLEHKRLWNERGENSPTN